MKKVFLLTKGVYSEKYVVGVFSTRKKAEEFMLYNLGDDDYVDIEVANLDESIDRNEKLWRVNMSQGTSCAAVTSSRYHDKDTFQYDAWFGGFYFYVMAETSEKAVKIASERRSYIISHTYLFPFFDDKIVRRCISIDAYPVYDFFKMEVILRSDERINDKYKDKNIKIRYRDE